MTHLITILLFIFSIMTVTASEPFIGRIQDYNKKTVKNAIIYTGDPKVFIKSDKKGIFTLTDVNPTETIHVKHGNSSIAFPVGERNEIVLIIGADGRIFEESEYTGETFHGTLLNHNGRPIKGAIVYIHHPLDNVKTNRQGEFIFDNAEPDDTLHIRYNDYIHDIPIDGSKGMYIIIGRSNGRRANDNLVNIGAGAVSEREYNGSLNVFTSQRLEQTGESSLHDALLRCPGIAYRYDPQTKERRLSINGMGRFDPLWILDGIVMESCPDIYVMEVERVQVLKDGAMYGTRGAGGVIVITTKGNSL